MNILSKLFTAIRTAADNSASSVSETGPIKRANGPEQHASVALHQLDRQTNIREIAQEQSAKIFSNGTDEGYHEFGTNWWHNSQCPFSYQYLSLDSLYPEEYFAPGGGHPNVKMSGKIYNYMQSQYQKLFGKKFQSVIELGTGGGEITQHFHENQLDFLAVEGTTSGVERLARIGIPEDRIAKENLKFMSALTRRFDIAMCTEVAEHIEPWFASKAVDNCVRHSDVVWFSAAKGNARPHYHHMNEVPIKAWDNIFAHMGHRYFVELDGLASRADRIYMNEAAFSRAKAKIP